KRLAGKILTFKDLYNLKGIRTSGGSRSCREMIDLAAESARSLRTLRIEVAGKRIHSSLTRGVIHTQHTPFNPRRDNYQHPQDSSAGTDAGLAASEWLGFSTESDTKASI
ncbi:hypothetical protein CC78DRAFT_438951, partial [Lojkania enalia]